MAGAKTRDPEATRHAILKAAEEAFLARGFGDTPLSLIAKKAGVTKSLIHHHFESKEKLWKEVKHLALCGYAEKQEEIQSRGEVSLETLRESMVSYFRFLQENQDIIKLMAWMTVENLGEDDEDICVHDKLIEGATQQIEVAQKLGIVRDDMQAINVLMAFLTMVHGWFQDRFLFRKWVVEGSGPEAQAAADEAFLENAINFIASSAKRDTTE